MDHATPAPAPDWATRSVVEDGTIVHERLCLPRPLVADRCPDGLVTHRRPTEISVSVVDVPLGDSWVRAEPTIQIEGGSYSLSEALELHRAIAEAAALVTIR